MTCARPASSTWRSGRPPADGPGSVNNRDKPRGWRRLLLAVDASRKGLWGAWRDEAAYRQELVFALLAAPLGLWLGRNGLERALLVAPVLLVLIVELLNSAIEATVDRIGFERNELAGLAKDLGSAAVFVALVLVAIVWALLLLDR
jgi:diacylglycerol kinase (ATP)